MNCLALLLCILAVVNLIRANGSTSSTAAGAGAFVLSCDAKKSSSIIVSNGLRNVGNTCYMNAQLQCLFHIPAVRHIALSTRTTTTPVQQILTSNNNDIEISQQQQHVTTEASLAFKELVEGMVRVVEEKSLSAYMPRSFCTRLGIEPMKQQDSQEFWKLLLPAVGSEKLTDLFKGVYEDFISALDGSGRERRRDEVFLDLSLDVSTR
mmetsp:Transcript_11827/g.13401  ORF Transcript_11827/g.13401 Transcript_11827/m.13401 type:complete len:208 (+) Transcript_11827:77-700(+)